MRILHPGLIVQSHDLIERNPAPSDAEIREALVKQSVPLHRLREDPRRRAAGGPSKGRAQVTTIIENAHVVTMAGDEYAEGHIVIDGDRITAVGAGPAADVPGADRIDGTGCLATPGLVNAHHHLYQWASQGLATDGTLFEWLTTLYKPWSKMDAEVVGGAASAGLGWLALSGCNTASDHHYLFPAGRGDLFAAEIEAAAGSVSGSSPAAGRWTGESRRAVCHRTRWWRTSTRSSPRPRAPSTATTTPRSARCSGSRSLRAPRSR